jgi:hypothetical protein
MTFVEKFINEKPVPKPIAKAQEVPVKKAEAPVKKAEAPVKKAESTKIRRKKPVVAPKPS